MRKLTAAALVAAAALFIGCGPTAYRYRVGILTPNTPEGNACRRECLALIGACVYYRKGDVQVWIEAGDYSYLYGCPGLISDCLVTCPGAIVNPDDPPRFIAVPHSWQVEGGDEEYWDE